MPAVDVADRLFLTAAAQLVDESVGVVHALHEQRTDPGLPLFFHYSAQLSNTAELGAQPCALWTGAASVSRSRAAAQAMADAVALYGAAYRFQPLMPPVCSADAASFPCLAPSEFDWFSSAQYADPDFPWRRFDGDAPVVWVEAFDPLREETLFVPGAFVFHPHLPYVQDGEVAIAPTTSTGLVCDHDPRSAVSQAICDCLECDTLSLAWYRNVSPPHIRVETLSDANYDLVSRFERMDAKVTLLLVPSEFEVPTILAVISSSSSLSPALVCAASTHLTPELAVRRSLEMLAHVHQYCHRLHVQMAGSPVDGEREIRTQADHLRFWCEHRHTPLAAALLASTERISFQDVCDLSSADAALDLQYLLQQVAQAGHRVLIADLTTPDVATLGLTITRAFIPRLCPLLYGGARPLGSARLRAQLDAADITCRPPHPFPRKGVYM